MDNAQQHWKILQGLGNDLANKVREFMVIGDKNGVIVSTEDGLGFWFGKIRFVRNESRTATEPTPLDVPDLVQMAQCYTHILLLNKRGEIYSMGENYDGQLGLGTVDQQTHFSPQLISIPHKIVSVRCGVCHSLALTDDGKVWAWGWNKWSQAGLLCPPVTCPSPRQITELDPHRVVTIECGGYHSLALTDQGEVYVWGGNGSRQLGHKNGLTTQAPIRIPSPSPVKSIAAGNGHTLLLTKTGKVYACGRNGHGQLGFPTTIEPSFRLSKVEGLPPISQIASHHGSELSIAMSFDQRCFVWGQLSNRTFIFTPWELPQFYSTVESPLSFYSSHPNTPHSVSIPGTSSSLSARMSRLFDNPETSSDVQFVVEQRTIHAHRCILSNSSDYFARMFSETWLAPVDPKDPIVRVNIPDHSYQVFRVFLRFIYTGVLEVQPELLPELFDLASQYLVPYLQQLCISRMRTTLTTATCCLYYPLTHRHSLLPELATFQQELVQFASTRMSEIIATDSYQSMDVELRNELDNSIANLDKR